MAGKETVPKKASQTMFHYVTHVDEVITGGGKELTVYTVITLPKGLADKLAAADKQFFETSSQIRNQYDQIRQRVSEEMKMSMDRGSPLWQDKFTEAEQAQLDKLWEKYRKVVETRNYITRELRTYWDRRYIVAPKDKYEELQFVPQAALPVLYPTATDAIRAAEGRAKKPHLRMKH